MSRSSFYNKERIEPPCADCTHKDDAEFPQTKLSPTGECLDAAKRLNDDEIDERNVEKLVDDEASSDIGMKVFEPRII